jgi:thioredoxin-related protein
MKRYILSLFLILATVWVWCNFSSAVETNRVAATAINTIPVNLPAEIARAKAENKLLLLEFGSSDACPPCIVFQQQVASQPEFIAYAKTNLIFVRLDYPMRSELPPDVLAANMALAQQFDAYGYPTFIGLDHEGKEFWRQEGIARDQMTPKTFIALIESVKAKQK